MVAVIHSRCFLFLSVQEVVAGAHSVPAGLLHALPVHVGQLAAAERGRTPGGHADRRLLHAGLPGGHSGKGSHTGNTLQRVSATNTETNCGSPLQDIAVDGWALTMLSRENVGYASTCNSVGQTAGYFMGNVLFLALESADFCNKYLRVEPKDTGIVTLSGSPSPRDTYVAQGSRGYTCTSATV